MRVPTWCIAVCVLAACTPRVNTDPETGDIDVDMEPVTQRGEGWSANLAARAGSGVTGNARATVSAEQTTATVNLMGARPGAVHPWHIHSGTCETGGPVVGGGRAYPPLQVGQDGRGTASAQVPAALNEAQQYHVNIHASPTEMATIVACGNLDD